MPISQTTFKIFAKLVEWDWSFAVGVTVDESADVDELKVALRAKSELGITGAFSVTLEGQDRALDGRDSLATAGIKPGVSKEQRSVIVKAAGAHTALIVFAAPALTVPDARAVCVCGAAVPGRALGRLRAVLAVPRRISGRASFLVVAVPSMHTPHANPLFPAAVAIGRSAAGVCPPQSHFAAPWGSSR